MAKQTKLWDNYQVLAEVQKNERLKLVIAGAVRDGVRSLVIREFYMRKKDGAWMPGRDGIVVPLMMPINYGKEIVHPLPELLKSFNGVIETIESMALTDPEHEVWITSKDKE